MEKTDAPELDPLASRLEEALLLSGKSQTDFGYTHFRDPGFFLKMRRGRRFRPKMAAKIADVVGEYGA